MESPDTLDESETLSGLQDLLLAVADGHSPDRSSSVLYMHLREQLLDSGAAGSVPGYLVQCVSISRFRTFIELFHPERDARAQFIRSSLDPCWRVLQPHSRSNQSYDFLDDF